VLQTAQNGRDRRRKMKQLAEKAGINIADVQTTATTAAIEKTTKTGKQLAVEEGLPLIGSIAGGAIGGTVAGYPGYLAGDLAGTMVMRKGLLDLEATRKAQQKLNTSVNYRNATKLERLKMLGAASISELKTPEMQSKIAQRQKEDLAGWAIGNSMGKVGYNPIVAGGTAAATTKSIIAAGNVVKQRGPIGALSLLVKSIANTPTKIKTSIKTGNQREEQVRANIKQAILAAKAARKIDAMDKNADVLNLNEVNEMLAQLEDLFKETVAFYYDNISIKEFITYDFRDNLLVGQFLSQDNQTYSIQIDKQGEPTLFAKSIPLDVLAKLKLPDQNNTAYIEGFIQASQKDDFTKTQNA
jgi:hypothetical protein